MLLLVFASLMMVGVWRLLLLTCVVSTMTTTNAAVVDDEPWNGLEHVDICSDVDYPSAGETCTLCPAALSGVSIWRCCHDPRVFEDCTAAVDSQLEASDSAAEKRRTKYFLGKKRAVKYFLGRRSSDNYFDRQHLAEALAMRRQRAQPDKRVKYFLG